MTNPELPHRLYIQLLSALDLLLADWAQSTILHVCLCAYVCISAHFVEPVYVECFISLCVCDRERDLFIFPGPWRAITWANQTSPGCRNRHKVWLFSVFFIPGVVLYYSSLVREKVPLSLFYCCSLLFQQGNRFKKYILSCTFTVMWSAYNTWWWSWLHHVLCIHIFLLERGQDGIWCWKLIKHYGCVRGCENPLANHIRYSHQTPTVLL